MRKETRIAFNGYMAQQAKINGVDSAAEKFTVAPAPAQKLDSAIQESNAFLKKINIIPVDEAEGEAILLGVNGPTASRTNTSNGARRKALDVSALTKDTYACKKTNFDTAFPYAKLDVWAKFQDFQTRLSNSIAEQQGLDRIMIGFNGVSAAADTNLGANGVQDDVLTTIMVWRFDAGDFAGALDVADYVIKYNLIMPDRFARTTGCLVAEDVAEAALKAQKASQTFPLDILTRTAVLTEEQDMPDQARAKLVLALGRATLDGITDEQPGQPGQLTAGIDLLKRAIELHDKCGAKKDLERAERLLKKHAGTAG